MQEPTPPDGEPVTCEILKAQRKGRTPPLLYIDGKLPQPPLDDDTARKTNGPAPCRRR
jgi:hypothetical protein